MPRSAALWERARDVVAGGSSHDSWRGRLFPAFATRAGRGRKYDADGHELVDLWMGHGALLFGHGDRPVIRAVTAQLQRGTHLGPHLLEARWAEEIRRLMPSLERVRFTASGSEAVSLATRVARAATGRDLIARIRGHFHGWHDIALAQLLGHGGGLQASVTTGVRLLPDGDLRAADTLLASRQVAAIILEPGGGSAGALPSSRKYLRGLRRLTAATGTLLIFDEVISGFRYAPGGAQQLAVVRPDLTVLAKIMCGGLPGGAVGGRADVMKVFEEGALAHTGTFNANPLSAAAGLACLRRLGDGRAQRRASDRALELAQAVNARAAASGADVQLFATHSVVHTLIGARGAGIPAAPSQAAFQLQIDQHEAHLELRQALLIEGVDTHPVHGWVSAAHTHDDIIEVAEAYRRVFRS